jgi:quinolinate synthase
MTEESIIQNSADEKRMLLREIAALKKKRDARFLVHNYQLEEVQEIADYLGDSLGLAQQANASGAGVIVLCGVEFMAQTVKLLNPDNMVLLPEKEAGCPMADMITEEELLEFRREHPQAKVVAYVNSTVEVKAHSDICCTSANAAKVVSSFPESEEIIFVPDKYLGSYVQGVSKRKLLLWNGFCPTHARLLAEDIIKAKERYPAAKVVVHPECRPEVLDLADAVRSTGGMIRYVAEVLDKQFIIGTELGMVTTLRRKYPEREFYSPAPEKLICPNMKMTTLESVHCALEKMTGEITIPERYITPAREAIEKMLALGRGESG